MLLTTRAAEDIGSVGATRVECATRRGICTIAVSTTTAHVAAILPKRRRCRRIGPTDTAADEGKCLAKAQRKCSMYGEERREANNIIPQENENSNACN